MYIRCWGSRGSIPVSGKEFSRYGGDTTCLEIRADSGHVIVVDAGTGIRRLGSLLCTEHIQEIEVLLTHCHWDHIMGFPFFKPLFVSGNKICVRSPRLEGKNSRSVISSLMSGPFFPVKMTSHDIKAALSFKAVSEKSFSIGSIKVRTIPISHPNGGVGYRFEENGKSVCFLPDNELAYVHEGGKSFTDYVEFCRGADLLIHDAEYYDEEYRHIIETSELPWGHSVFTDTIRLAEKSGSARLGLFHINQNRTDEQVDQMVKEAKEIIAAKGGKLICTALGSGWEMAI